MKRLLSFFFLILTVHEASAFSGQLSVRGGTWSFATENVRSSNDSSSGIGAYSFEVAYRIASSWTVNAGLSLILSEIYKGSSGYGFDVGGRYYPLTDAGTIEMSSGVSDVTIQESWRPYLGIAIRQRIFGLAISTSYLGPGVSFGVDYSLSKKWFLSAEFRYDYLYGQGDALAVQNNILFGAGIEF